MRYRNLFIIKKEVTFNMKVNFTPIHIQSNVTIASYVSFTMWSCQIIGQQDTHPAMILLLSTCSFLLLLVLPNKQNGHSENRGNVIWTFQTSLYQCAFSFKLLPTFVAQFERPSPCPFCPSVLPPWPLCLSSLDPAAAAPPLPYAAPPADVSLLLSKSQTDQ